MILFAAQDAACDVDVFAPGIGRFGQRLLHVVVHANPCQLDQHRQIDAGDTSILPVLIAEMDRLEGVPPNMSVRITTPWPSSTLFTASRIS